MNTYEKNGGEGVPKMEASHDVTGLFPRRTAPVNSIYRPGRGSVEFYELGHEPRVMHPGIQ